MDAFPVGYAKSYIDRLFEERNLLALHQVIAVLGRERELPEEFWLFSRLLEWVGSTRSGVWQYYEAISTDDAERIFCGLERLGLHQIAFMYQSGRNGGEDCDGLDDWIDTHSSEIETAAFGLIVGHRTVLI